MGSQNDGTQDLEYTQENQRSGANDRDIQLTASVSGNKVTISGPPGPFTMAVNSPAARFRFSLVDNTGLGVRFSSLDSADNNSNCPPPSGENSQQLVAVTINPTDAAFTDNNSNNAANGPMNVSFQWNFTCNDPSKQVGSYDPIISNGGKSTGIFK